MQYGIEICDAEQKNLQASIPQEEHIQYELEACILHSDKLHNPDLFFLRK